MEKQKEGEEAVNYDISYEESKDAMLSRIQVSKITEGADLEATWLPEHDENVLAEAERLNVLLPMFEWEIENDTLTPELKDELYLYYEDLMEGRLDGILGEDEADVVVDVLTKCYFKVFDKYPDE